MDRFYPQERGEEEVNPPPDLLVWVLDDLAGQVAHQSDRKALGQVATSGLVDQAGVEAGLDRVKFQFRDLALQLRGASAR